MKTTLYSISRIFLINTIMVAIFLHSCREEEILPSAIQFESSTQNLPEGQGTAIILSLDRAVLQDQTIEVSFESNAINNQHFSIIPDVSQNAFSVTVKKGMKTIQFSVQSIDNSTFDDGKYIIFRLANPSDGLKLGPVTTNTLTITDDEGPSLSSFESDSSKIDELNANGKEIKIRLESPAKGTGSIEITYSALVAVYEKDFMINPIPKEKNSH